MAEGRTSWETELLTYLTEHVQREAQLLADYQHLCGETNEGYVSYLMRLLVEDETRHHRLFLDMANSLGSQTRPGATAPIPPVTPTTRAHELLVATERYLAAENDDAEELERFAQRLRRAPGSPPLWSLLVELMERDTQKHLSILRFIRARIHQQQTSPKP
jgi:hypothetical protein